MLIVSSRKMFYLVGLGLADVKDITVKGLEIVKRASKVYLEAYTSILTVGKEALVRFKFSYSLYLLFLKGFFNLYVHVIQPRPNTTTTNNRRKEEKKMKNNFTQVHLT